jgi:O-antigen/teichoic acid export membrane protein
MGLSESLQAYQLMRFGFNLLTALVLSRLAGSAAQLAPFETFLLLHTLLTFAPIWAITRNFTAAYANVVPERRAQVLSNSFYLSALAALLVLPPLGLALFWALPAYAQQIPLLLLFSAGTLVGSLAEFYLMVRRRRRWLVAYGLVNFGLPFLLTALIYYCTQSFAPVFTLLGGIGLLRLLVVGLLIGPRLQRPRLSKALLAQGRKLLPLLGMTLIGGGKLYLDGLLVRIIHTDAIFVWFRYGARELPLAAIMAAAATATLTSQIPRLQRSQGPAAAIGAVQAEMRKLCHRVFPIAIVMMPLAPLLFQWLLGPHMAPAARLFQILLLTTATRVLIPQTYLYAAEKNKTLLQINIFEWLLHIVLAISVLLTLKWYLVGYAVVASSLFEKAYIISWLHKRGQVPLHAYPWRIWGLYTAALLLIFSLSHITGAINLDGLLELSTGFNQAE